MSALGVNLDALGANLDALGANLDALGANLGALGANLGALGLLKQRAVAGCEDWALTLSPRVPLWQHPLR